MDDDGIVLDFTDVKEYTGPRTYGRGGRPLSVDPKRVRARIRKAAGKVDAEIEVLYHDRKPIEEWDYEELSRGRPKGDDGKFHGPAPRWITPVIRDEAKRRLQARGKAQMEAQLGQAIEVIGGLMTDDTVDDMGKPNVTAGERLKAAMFIVDHSLGRATAKVEVDLGEKTRSMLASAIVLPDGTPMLEATVLEDDASDEE